MQGFGNVPVECDSTRSLEQPIHLSRSECREVVISLNAEKTFDYVEREYLLFILQKFGIGYRLISWIKLLYSSPLTSVVYNSIKSI